MANEIKCPKCGTNITIDEAIVQKMVNLKVQKSLNDEKERLEKEIKSELEKEQAESLKSIQVKLDDARKKELNFLRKQSDLEDRLKSQELEIARKIKTEKSKILEAAQKDAETLWQLKLAERDKQLEDQKKLISEMQRKAHQGSMQTQGEVLELSIEDLLKQNFPYDKIEPVPKGISGADIIQVVYGSNGQVAGKIAWETKRTKNWTEDWVQKLKDDARNIKADISVLVTDSLPKEINGFGQYKGVWLCNFSLILGVAYAMRNQLISVSGVKSAETGKDQKMEAIYNYLCSNTFAQKVQALVETYDHMKQALDTEKRAMTKIWSTRETQILRLTENTAKMYGEIQGIAGSALPQIELLELKDGEMSEKNQDQLL